MSEKSTVLTYTASGAAIFGGLTVTDWAAIVGAVVAVISLVYNVWHKRELRKIARAQMAAAATVLACEEAAG